MAHTLKLRRGSSGDEIDMAQDSATGYGLMAFDWKTAVRTNATVGLPPSSDGGYISQSAQPLSVLSFVVDITGSTTEDCCEKIIKLNRILADAVLFAEKKYIKIGDRQAVSVEWQPSGGSLTSVYWNVLGVVEWPVTSSKLDDISLQHRAVVSFRLLCSAFSFGDRQTAVAAVMKTNSFSKLNAVSTSINKGDVGALWNISYEDLPSQWERIIMVECSEITTVDVSGSVDASAIGGQAQIAALTTSTTEIGPSVFSLIRGIPLRFFARVKVASGGGAATNVECRAVVQNAANAMSPAIYGAKRYGPWTKYPTASTDIWRIVDLGEIRVDDLFLSDSTITGDVKIRTAIECRMTTGTATISFDAYDAISYRSMAKLTKPVPETTPEGYLLGAKYQDWYQAQNTTAPQIVLSPTPICYATYLAPPSVYRADNLQREGKLDMAPTFRGTTIATMIETTQGHTIADTFEIGIDVVCLYASGLRGVL